MKESFLIKIALLCAVVGVVVLFIFSEAITVDETMLNKINEMELEDYVKVKGVVDRVTQLESVAFVEVKQPQTMTIVLFKDSSYNISVYEGDYIEVIGKIDEYEGKRQIIGKRIRKIK